jgi:hypothetical protein
MEPDNGPEEGPIAVEKEEKSSFFVWDETGWEWMLLGG